MRGVRLPVLSSGSCRRNVIGMRTALRTHSGLAELAIAAALYGLYEVIRGMGSTTFAAARAHTADIVSVERHLGFFVERSVQHAVDALPTLPMLLGFAYMSLHFGATAAVMVWVHRKHRERFAIVRTTLVVSTAISLAIYILYPAAPPRLAGLGFADTVTEKAGINLSSDALGSLYNPFAAVPSLHFGYALLVGVTVAVLAKRRWVRWLGAAYPPFMLFTIVATGNHFFLDAIAGGIVVVIGYLGARRVVERGDAALGRPCERTLRCVEECAAEHPAELVPAADLPTRLAA
jgi:PAP2 superfamily